jgi:hypothetical protein
VLRPPVPCPRPLNCHQDPLKRSSVEEPSARTSLRRVRSAADFTTTSQRVGKGGECIVEGLTPYVGPGCIFWTEVRAVRHLTIGQLAKRARVHVETIRYYERRGLLPEPTGWHLATVSTRRLT